MFRNYLAAALRNMARNRLYTLVNILGLSVGFAAALLIAIFVWEELSYDTWVPGYRDIYRISFAAALPGQGLVWRDHVPVRVAEELKADFSQIRDTTRLAHAPRGETVSLRAGTVEANEPNFYWADANFFAMFPVPVVAGDLATALARPDGIVLTRATARRYFGRDNAIGQTIEINRRNIMTVTAVVDLPSNSHFAFEVLASARASFSQLAMDDAQSNSRVGQAYTYVRLDAEGAVQALSDAFPDFLDRRMPTPPMIGVKASIASRLRLDRIDTIHLQPAGLDPMKASADAHVVYAVGIIGLLIAAVASVNFISLTSARALRRSVEVGVRKVSGAQKRDLRIQFIGEAVVHIVVGLFAAAGLAVVALPRLDIGTAHHLAWSAWTVAAFIGELTLAAVCIGVLSGVYPAFLLAGLSPRAILKSQAAFRSFGPNAPRRILVALQFAVLIGLLLATITIYRQVVFATNESFRFDKDEVLIIRTSCGTAFSDEVKKLPGIRAAACSAGLLDADGFGMVRPLRDGTNFAVNEANLEPGFLELYGIAPLAGRSFTAADALSRSTILVNESFVRRYGYASDAAAVGENPFGADGPHIIGVIPDFSMTSAAALPMNYWPGGERAPHYQVLNVKIAGRDIPETLAAIDQVWRRLGDRAGPIRRVFFDQYMEGLYLGAIRQSALFSAFAAVALVVSALGLFGLSAFTAETHTKEIGIRKTMGATSADVLRLFLWQFAKPVLWANAVAWPAAYLILKRWLEGFAYHIDLAPWMFFAASALALVIAVATVIGHALLVARAQPVTALRYE